MSPAQRPLLIFIPIPGDCHQSLPSTSASSPRKSPVLGLLCASAPSHAPVQGVSFPPEVHQAPSGPLTSPIFKTRSPLELEMAFGSHLRSTLLHQHPEDRLTSRGCTKGHQTAAWKSIVSCPGRFCRETCNPRTAQTHAFSTAFPGSDPRTFLRGLHDRLKRTGRED